MTGSTDLRNAVRSTKWFDASQFTCRMFHSNLFKHLFLFHSSQTDVSTREVWLWREVCVAVLAVWWGKRLRKRWRWSRLCSRWVCSLSLRLCLIQGDSLNLVSPWCCGLASVMALKGTKRKERYSEWFISWAHRCLVTSVFCLLLKLSSTGQLRVDWTIVVLDNYN